MHIRPWPLVFLAIYQIISPAFNLILSAYVDGMPVWEYTSYFVKNRPLYDLADFFLLYPIAGVSIYLMKKWSYPVFLVIMVYTIGMNIWTWRLDYMDSPMTPLIVLIQLLNVALVTYYLLPGIRKIYFDKRLRWWEAKPRYQLQLDCEARSVDWKAAAHIVDFSVGGVLAKIDQDLETGTFVRIHFITHDFDIDASGVVVHKGIKGERHYGVVFKELDSTTAKKIAQLARTLRKSGVPSRFPPETKLENLKNWAKTLAKTGKGIVPDVPNRK